jgi:hypothetical protein
MVRFNLYLNYEGADWPVLAARFGKLRTIQQPRGNPIMLTYLDCVELSDLTEEEIEAIAQHEHLPEMAALEMGSYLVHSAEGVPMIKRIILEDIDEERRRGHAEKALQLKLVLKHFVDSHPDNLAKS